MTKITKLKITELKRHLKEYDQKELIGLISELYKVNNDVAHYLSAKFLGEEVTTELFLDAQKEIKEEFFPDRGHGKLRLAKAKTAIANFKKLTNDYNRTVELMLFYVEMGTKFTSAYGDIDIKFYESMVLMYEKVAIECDKDDKLFNKLADRLYGIIVASDSVGWGYPDALEDIYYTMERLADEEED